MADAAAAGADRPPAVMAAIAEQTRLSNLFHAEIAKAWPIFFAARRAEPDFVQQEAVATILASVMVGILGVTVDLSEATPEGVAADAEHMLRDAVAWIGEACAATALDQARAKRAVN